jgi:hypothetical protein
LESFSYALQIDMHFICTPMWTKNIILVKSGCYTSRGEGQDQSTRKASGAALIRKG